MFAAGLIQNRPILDNSAARETQKWRSPYAVGKPDLSGWGARPAPPKNKNGTGPCAIVLVRRWFSPCVRDDFADGMGRICTIYGINPLYGRMYGALYLTPRPVSLGDVATMLGTAKSTASVGLRQLEAFGLVRRSRRLRDRRDYYEAETDGRTILTGFLRNYMERELNEGLRMAQQLKDGMQTLLQGPKSKPIGGRD